MPRDPDPPEDREMTGEFGLVLDEDLLAAALNAVEKREGRKRRTPATPVDPFDQPAAAAEPAADPAPDPAEAGIDIEVELGEGDGGEAPAAPPPAGADALHTAALHDLRDQLTAVQAELAALQSEAEAQLERLRASEQERRRLMGAQRRLEEQLARTGAAAEQALAARKAAEEQAQTLRRRVEQLEDDLHQLRERRRREQEEQRQHGHARTVEAVLPVLDNLELALSHQRSEPARVVQGVEMILQQFHQAVQQLGLQRIVATTGVLFDPELHEAVTEVLTDELLPGSIVEEVRPGYALNGRLLRAARVTVATTVQASATDQDAATTTASEGGGSPEDPSQEPGEADVTPQAPTTDD